MAQALWCVRALGGPAPGRLRRGQLAAGERRQVRRDLAPELHAAVAQPGIGQAEGFERALRAYAQDCLAGSDCPLSGDVDTAVGQIQSLLDGWAAAIVANDAERIGAFAEDGWTLVGRSGNLSAQYEHTMIITRGAPVVVTAV